MAKFDYDLGILGGGAAGLTAAAGAAQFGSKTVIVEKHKELGGDCLHFGCVPSKTLIRTARVWNLVRRTTEFGLPAVGLPPVDLRAVMDRVHSVIKKIQENDSTERFCSLGAEVRFGQPTFVDDHVVEVDGTRISARAWIVSTGSSPAPPPVEGLADVPYWTNETVFTQRTLPSRLLVLGGPVGLEMAQAFQRLGSQVTVVDFINQILGPEDPDIAGILRSRLEAEGVELHTSTKTVKAESNGSSIRLSVAPAHGEGKTRVVEGDALLVATGRRPNGGDLGLDTAGVQFTPHGITTDDRMRTNVHHILEGLNCN
jgi:pyruvate/2-oxoglutarate dehydrogenase complex dihydrolipoamide dehydrogenase (E3) component